MTETKHSPGPWEVQALNFGEFELNAGNHEIALIYGGDGMDEPTKFPSAANANLIKTAPDLLAALQSILWCEDHGDGIYDRHDDGGLFATDKLIEAMAAAKAAVARATGQT